LIRVHNHLCVNMCVLWCERRVCLRVCVCARLRALPVARILCVFVWVCVCVGGGWVCEVWEREPGGEWLFICVCTHPRERDIQKRAWGRVIIHMCLYTSERERHSNILCVLQHRTASSCDVAQRWAILSEFNENTWPLCAPFCCFQIGRFIACPVSLYRHNYTCTCNTMHACMLAVR